MSERVPKHTCSQSAVRGVSFNDREKRDRMDISRSIIDKEKLKIKNRKISEEQNIKKKGYDQARGESYSLVFPIVDMPGLCTYVWGGEISK